MGNSESDGDLQRAIQLSLESDQPEAQTRRQGTHEVVNIDSDDETTTDESDAGNVAPVTATVAPTPATGMLGLDRKAMEQERLARKRKASISPPIRKVAKYSGSLLQKPIDISGDAQPSAYRLAADQTKTKLLFPNGTVKKTWAFGHPRQGDDIKLEEVLQKNDLGLAVLSSFQWDVDWLLRKIDTKTTQLVFVMQADTEETKAQYRRETAAMPNLRLCFPSMEGQVNCMHSKLMLLSYPAFLRVVVPTANLVPYDWGETGVMENTVFLIDLPRLHCGQMAEEDQMTDFAKNLIYFLQAMGLDRSIIDSIRQFEFSATEGLAFVHTIGGAHMGDNEPWRRTGYCGLGRAIAQLGLAEDNEPLAIEYVTSSVGSLNMDFLVMLQLAAQGDDGMKEYEWRNTTLSKKSKGYQALQEQRADAQERARKQVEQGFRIVFPSEETVKASKGGPESGGTICFQRKWWESPTFPRDLMRDCKSRRKGMLMHNKIMYVYPRSTMSTRSASKTWAYVGSANCSESAWGKLVKDRKEKQPKLNCRNWECGVVLPLRLAAATSEGSATTEPEEGRSLAAFERLIPVPFEYPAEGYAERTPWFYSD
ncbi:MAG: hypothetical protein LQ338_004900 [Usnochroma carphineum]|nr:MAG: hypothetical protein LQ338_004900 [Usnochroma carphineum]